MKHVDEQSKESCRSFLNLQPNVTGNSGKITMLEDEKGMSLSRFPASAQSFPSKNGPEHKRATLPCSFIGQGWCANVNSCRFLHVFANSISSFPLRNSFVQEHGFSMAAYGKTDMASSGPVWKASLFSSAPMNQYASPVVQAIYVSLLATTRKFLQLPSEPF